MIIEKRSIAMCIVLSIITCGIYGLIWLAWLNDDANRVSGEENPTSGGMVVLLSIITCGIYGLYWAYKQGEKLDRATSNAGMPNSNRSIIYLVLCLFGLGLIAYALMQDELNNIADTGVGHQYQQPYYGQAPGQPYQQPQQPYYGQAPEQQYQQPQQPYYGQATEQQYQQPQQPYYGQAPEQQYQQPQQPNYGQAPEQPDPNNQSNNTQDPNS